MTNTSSAVRVAPSPADGEHVLLPWLRMMRDEHPVWRDDYNIWHVFRYDDVQRITADPATFSSDTSRVIPSTSEFSRGSLVRTDPPEHRSLRRLVSAVFTPRRVAGLEPRIAEITHALLDRADGEFELVETLAYPLPVTVIAELLGVPTSDRELFRAWTERLFSLQVDDPTDPNLRPRAEAAMRDLFGYLGEHVRDRRAHPGTDLISALVTAEVDGEQLDDQSCVNFATVLLIAGHITTTVLLGNAVRCLDECPDAYAELRADPSLIPAAIEEVLRYRSSFTQIGRVTTREVEVAGQLLPADALVMPWLLSANRDERVFADPDRFDIHRTHNEQIAFGHGIHFCLGAPLARLEGKVALGIMIERFAELRVTPGTTLELYPRGILGAKRLPVTARRADHRPAAS